jgi:Tfp pilus assembly protein FimT
MKMPRAIRFCAFTLIEILISTALMAMILVSAYLCLSAGIAGEKIVEPRADIFQTARVTMALLTADLRGACPLPGDSAFIGMQRTVGQVEADNLDFATHNYTPHHAHEGDFCEVSYYVNQDPQTGHFSLWRRQNPTIAPDPLSGGRKEEIAPDVLGVRFEYFDGVDWYDNWGGVKDTAGSKNTQGAQDNLGGMPEAVRITLMMDSDPTLKTDAQTDERKIGPPLVFQTVAYLNLADASQDNTGSSTANSNENPGSQSTSGTQNGGGN